MSRRSNLIEPLGLAKRYIEFRRAGIVEFPVWTETHAGELYWRIGSSHAARLTTQQFSDHLDRMYELARCDREIREIEQQEGSFPHLKGIALIGLTDWQAERRLILEGV